MVSTTKKNISVFYSRLKFVSKLFHSFFWYFRSRRGSRENILDKDSQENSVEESVNTGGCEDSKQDRANKEEESSKLWERLEMNHSHSDANDQVQEDDLEKNK